MKKKYYSYIVIVAAFSIGIMLLAFLPPIMIVKTIPMVGKETKGNNDPALHLMKEEEEFASHHVYENIEVENLYFINLKWWEKVEVKEIALSEAEDTVAEGAKKYSFLYIVKYMNKGANHHCYFVKRGDRCWYYDLYTSEVCI